MNAMTKSSKIKVRVVSEKDLADIFRIELEAFGKEAYPKWVFQQGAKLLRRTFMVAELDGKAIGYVMAHVKGKIGEIISIAVHPQHRRKGIGELLMEEIIRKLQSEFGVKRVKLQVKVSNKPAIKLYEKLGFKIGARLKEYYPDGEDAYEMYLDL
ncbi:ribosomal-protein-alanine N-acetyltransferase [archaeon]|nr:MAG: ribosomal-protein-alanine N-acetyltransferase [archaeon]RLG64847.1 MAG: ribosomal-protein-alanine N-acetyltransferase [archaeon]HDM23416.1 ribosomal-protein-alanine N-acetyltransferase [Candidatus Bathyarchaeota archaeon]